jgi:N-dimethylarginine dimethylaminohydrolase
MGIMKTERPRILMCPPDYYGIEYEINEWMNRARPADTVRARRQWQALHEALTGLGVEVSLLEARPGLPDLVFTANAGLVFHQRFISSRFKHGERAGETPCFDEWFAGAGFQVEHLPAGLYFEGAGDALFCGPILFAGYRFRSDALAHQEVARMINRRVLPLELVNPRFYHLDTCFCPLAPGEAIYFPDAFDDYGKRVLREHVPKLYPVPEADALRFGCNAVVVGRTVVTNTGCPGLAKILENAGYQTVAVELDEFLKAGGSAKCLTIRLDGEEAAVWE